MKILDFMFGSFTFYTRILVSKITKGYKDRPLEEEPLADDEFYYSINRIYTKTKVKKMFFVRELPRNVDVGFLYDLKSEIDTRSAKVNQSYGTRERCELVSIVTAAPYELNFSTFRNRSRMMMWKKRYETALREQGGETALDDMVAQQDVLATKDRNRWMIESWMFVRRAKDVEKSSFCKTNIVFELVADTDNILKECELTFKDYMFRNDIKYGEVFLQTNEYQKAFSPAANDKDNLLAKMNPPTILNDAILSEFDVPTHGRVGDDVGLYVGTDIYTGLPVFYDVRKGSDAINFLVTAKTGHGKSNYTKGLYSFIDLLGINTITLDYEGDEYTNIGSIYDATFVKVSGDQSRYFNTIAIGDLTGDLDLDRNLKTDAVNVTERVFSLLVSEQHGMNNYQTSLFSDCIQRVYEKAGVTDDMNTWYLSKELTFFSLYGELVEMAKLDKYMQSEKTADALEEFIITLKPYFEYGGMYRSMFADPISIDELLGSRHVVFSFGMKGADESTTNTVSLALKQLFVGYITTLISNYNKSRGKLTAIFIEEMQRYLMHEHSGSVVANMVSGGRKRGMIMFLITNAPLQLVKSYETENAEKAQYMHTIISNITAQIIGHLDQSTSEVLAEHFSLLDSLDAMTLINQGGDMKYSFLVNYKGETSIVKYLFHPDLLKKDIYATRRDHKEDVIDVDVEESNTRSRMNVRV